MTASLLKSVQVHVVDSNGNSVPLMGNPDGSIDMDEPVANAFESITVTDSHSESLTPATYGTSTKAVVTVEENSVRVRWDGTSPTTSIGHLLDVGSMIELFNDDIANFKAIAVGADAVLSVTYSE